MEPFAVTMGNVLLTLWIVGGFVTLLLLKPEEREVELSEPEELLGPAELDVQVTPSEEVAPPLPVVTVPDVHWQRRQSTAAVTRERAA